MPDDFPSQQKLDKQIVLAAIKAVKEKGWDVNPFTVADEARIPAALLYRDSEMMTLIVQERGGGYLDSSLNVASQPQDFATQNVQVKDNVQQSEQKLDDGPNVYPNERVGFQESDPMSSQTQRPNFNQSSPSPTAAVSQEPPKNRQDWQIYNVARVSPVASEFNPLVGLTWKDIETVYYMRVETLKEYARNITAPLDVSEASWLGSEYGPSYRPYLSQQEGESKDAGFVPEAPQIEARYTSPESSNGEADSPPEIASPEPANPPAPFTQEEVALKGNGELGFAAGGTLPEALPEQPQAASPFTPREPEAQAARSNWQAEPVSLPPALEPAPEAAQATVPVEAEAAETASAQEVLPFVPPQQVEMASEPEPMSSPFILPDAEQKATIRGKHPDPGIQNKDGAPAESEDSKVSPFQKLKTSASWPRPSSSQKPINLQERLGKGSKGQAPAKPELAPSQPAASAQEMAWGHFADSSQPVSQTPPAKAKPDQGEAEKVPHKPFANLFGKGGEKTKSPQQQSAWEHFSRTEDKPVESSPGSSSTSEKDLVAPAMKEAPVPDPEKSPTLDRIPSLDKLPSLDGTPTPGEFAGPESQTSAASEELPDSQIPSDISLAGPHYSFGTAYSFGFSPKTKSKPAPEAEVIETPQPSAKPLEDEAIEQPVAFTEEPKQPEAKTEATPVPTEIVEEVPDLDNLDIFDDIDQLPDLEEIEIIEEVVNDQGDQKANGLATTISGDELREIIKNRIKQANQQLAEPQAEATSDQEGEAESSKRAANRSKFVGAAKTHEPPKEKSFVPKTVAPEIRKACLLLGVRPEEITKETVIDAWKRQIASPGVHPDLGGDTESAIYLNTAKDTLIRWLEEKAPKLGKRFGQTVKTRAQTNAKKGSDKKDKAEKSE